MPKLNIEEGQNLVRAFMQSWPFEEHLFEAYQDFYDSYLVSAFPTTYKEAVKWEGGTSTEERKRFIKESNEIKQEHDRFFREHFLEEEFYLDDLNSIAKVILEVTHTMAKPFIDFNKEPEVVNISQGLKEVPEYYYKCPNCSTDHAFLSKRSIRGKCPTCRVTLNLKIDGKAL